MVKISGFKQMRLKGLSRARSFSRDVRRLPMQLWILMIIGVLLIYTSYRHMTSIAFLISSMPRLMDSEGQQKTLSLQELLEPSSSTYCNNRPLLTYVDYVYKPKPGRILRINKMALPRYTPRSESLSCCYSSVIPVEKHEDLQVGENSTLYVSPCTVFENEVELEREEEFIFVKCFHSNHQSTEENITDSDVVYKNMHATVPIKLHVQHKLKVENPSYFSPPLNVLMVEYDTLSKLNLDRTMPKTAYYLNNIGFINAESYHPLTHKSLPNDIALLTGVNFLQNKFECSVENGTQCPFIWRYLNENYYISAYIEDESNIDLFNTITGNKTTPTTDYYFQPQMFASELHFTLQKISELGVCMGPESTTDRVLKYTLNFVSTFSNSPFFAFVRLKNYGTQIATYSTKQDSVTFKFFSALNTLNIFKKTIVVFLSSRGTETKNSKNQGWFEERLPFLYLFLPESYKKTHPDKYKTLLVNLHELFSPLDIYETLKDILNVQNSSNWRGAKTYLNSSVNTSVSSTSTGKSLLNAPLRYRSCSDVGIETQVCPRMNYREMPIFDPIIEVGGQHIVRFIDNLIKNSRKSSKCSTTKFKRIVKSRVLIPATFEIYSTYDDYYIQLEVSPSNTRFETIVRHIHNNKYKLQNPTIRVNHFQRDQNCSSDRKLQMYCICL